MRSLCWLIVQPNTHEIQNRFREPGFYAGDAAEFEKLKISKQCPFNISKRIHYRARRATRTDQLRREPRTCNRHNVLLVTACFWDHRVLAAQLSSQPAVKFPRLSQQPSATRDWWCALIRLRSLYRTLVADGEGQACKRPRSGFATVTLREFGPIATILPAW